MLKTLQLHKINPTHFVIGALAFLFGLNIYLSSIISITFMYQLIVVAGTMLTIELSIHFLKEQKRFFITNAAISSLIIAGIMDDQTPILYLVAMGAIASLSSELLRTNNRPIFNPAAFSLVLAALANTSIHYIWWINNPMVIVLPLSFLLITLTNKWHTILGFVAPLLLVYIYQNLSRDGLMINLINHIYALAFFVGVMLIEPRTSPIYKNDQYIFGLVVGISYIFLVQYTRNALLIALLFGNVTALISNKLKLKS